MNIFFQLLNIIYAVLSFFRRKVFLLNIKPDDLVLDIGSGDKPFWRADVFVDLYTEDDQQRFSGSMLYDKRKLFINANVEKLPFADKSFDFVFCSHLLEHVEHPERAIAEITRVGKRGYIEVPRAILDALAPFPPHLWFCETDGKTLIFKRKGKEKNFFLRSMESFGGKYFYTPLMQYLFMKNIDAGFIRYYWNNHVDFRIEKAEGEEYKYIYNPAKIHKKSVLVTFSHAVYKLFYLTLNALYYKEKKIDRNKILKH